MARVGAEERPMPRSRGITADVKRRRWTAADARVVLAALDASGLSTRGFARRERLSAERLYRWRQRLAAESRIARRGPAFVEIAPRALERVEIVLRSGRMLRVCESVDTVTLAKLVEALERPSSC